MKVSPQRHNLARLRLFLGFRQEPFAKLIGCARPTLQTFEHGRVQVPEQTAQRVAGETGVSIGWLLQNDLTAPIVSRSGTSYGLEHFMLAQLSLSREPSAVPAFYNGTDAAFEEEILMAVARLKQVYDNLVTRRSQQEVVSSRLRHFLASLEKDFGPDPRVGQMDYKSDDECVIWGKTIAADLLKKTKMPERWYELEIRRREAEEIDAQALASLKPLTDGLKPAQIPEVIQSMREKAAKDFAEHFEEEEKR